MRGLKMAGDPRNSRAPYAADPARSLGRLHPEPPSPTRDDFQRDRDRIIHSTAFRRLAHKTQVFVYHEGDHFRSRLTHTIEVAQLARALARALQLDDELTEAVALGHDLGHTPFGHTGEDALDACMAAYGSFDHNSHGLRLVTELERRYADFDGLNLTQETLEGLVKHNGPLVDAEGRPCERWRTRGVPLAILAYDRLQSLHLAQYASLEAQAAAIADDIAYDAHDVDDGLRAGLLSFERLAQAELTAIILAEIKKEYPDLAPERVRHEIVRWMITLMIEDVIGESLRLIDRAAPASAADVRAAGRPLIAFSAAMDRADRRIKAMLTEHVYRHPAVGRVMSRAEEVVRRLFERYSADRQALPEPWRPAEDASPAETARTIADFLAGMTDRYALAEYQRLFDEKAELG